MLRVFSGCVSLQMSAPQLAPHLPAEGHVPGGTTGGGALASGDSQARGWGRCGGVSTDTEDPVLFRACPELV